MSDKTNTYETSICIKQNNININNIIYEIDSDRIKYLYDDSESNSNKTNIQAINFNNDTIIITLELLHNKIDNNEHILKIMKNLCSNTTMQYEKSLQINKLKLWNNEIENPKQESIEMKYLGELLEVNKTITELDLWNNKINIEGMKYLSDSLKINKTLMKLKLWSVKKGIKYLSDALIVNNTINILDLSDNEIRY